MNNKIPANAHPLYIEGMPYYVNLYAESVDDTVTVYTQCDMWMNKEPRIIGTYSAEYFRDCRRDVMMQATSKLRQLHGFSKAVSYQ
jgi:hypothetical protein